MKVAIFLISLFVLLSCNLTNKINSIRHDADYLARYSYLIWWTDSMTKKTHQGTCFFMESENDTFMVTARHVLRTLNNLYPQKFTIMLNDNGIFNHKGRRLNYILTEKMSVYNTKIPDIIAAKMEHNPRNFPVRTINHLIRVDAIPQLKNSISLIGYPVNHNRDTIGGFTFTDAVNYSSYIDSLKTNFPFYNDNRVPVDSFNYSIRLKNASPDSSFGGFSGSPTFTKNKKSDKWVFLGIVSLTHAGRLFIIKSKYMFDAIRAAK